MHVPRALVEIGRVCSSGGRTRQLVSACGLLVYFPTCDTTAKSISELRRMQRNQLYRVTKEDLIKIILTSPEQGGGHLTATLHELVREVAELKVINSPDSTIDKRFLDLQAQVDRQAQLITEQQRFLEMLDRRGKKRTW